CIDQANTHERRVQVQQVGRIYSQSELTIIATTSSGPEYGLPRVGARLRRSQPHLKFGDLHFLGLNLVPSLSLKGGTKWATRGWTLQEAVWARR
ncbi:hypothetical protein P154DRAFT_427663, partial [Amniculicola lignicola CBS 123094]